jgi:hypothetical protein
MECSLIRNQTPQQLHTKMNIKFSWHGLLHRIDWHRCTDHSKAHSDSICRVKQSAMSCYKEILVCETLYFWLVYLLFKMHDCLTGSGIEERHIVNAVLQYWQRGKTLVKRTHCINHYEYTMQN